MTKSKPTVGGKRFVPITGATISSESVATIVNKAIADLRGPIQQIRPDVGSAPVATPTPPGN